MKKIGLLSDTHGEVDERLFKYFDTVDEIWHAGDIGSPDVIEKLEAFKPFKGVYGNIDNHEIKLMVPEHQYFQCEQVRVLMTHIAGKPYKYYNGAHKLIKEKPCDLFICGHSHILKVQYDKNINALWMNPGAIGSKGFHKVKTALRFKIDGKDIKELEVIELDKKNEL